MSGGGSSKTEVNNKLPEWAEVAGKNLTQRAMAQSRAPYAEYDGDRVAALNQNLTTAFDLAQSQAGDWSPTWEEGKALTQQAATPWSAEAAAQYMNPYAKGVTDIAARELVRNEDIARRSRNANAVSAGAFGSMQQGIADAESDRNLQQTLSDTYLKGGASAWDAALAAYQGDRNAKLAAGQQLGAFATQRQALGQGDVNQMLTAGGVQQTQAQAELDQAYTDWKERQEHPWTQLTKATSILAATPVSRSQTTEAPGQSNTAGYVSAGVSIAATVAAAAIAA